MQGKYQNSLKFHIARWQRGVLRLMLRRLVDWQSLAAPEPGYSVIIGALATMPEVARANLRMLERQNTDHLREVIIVFDQPRETLPPEFERDLQAAYPRLPLRCLFYNRAQARRLRLIGWGWCYSWLSWCLGIAACRTRHALLHDLDALLLRPDILEQRYQAIRRVGHEFLGRGFYNGNGIHRADGLAVTFELMFDAQWVRRMFRPIELFNRIGWFRGRRVEFDTFLHAQASRGRIDVLPIDPEDLVHPSQVFCQYTELANRPRYVPPEANNLPMLPYLLHLGGHPHVLARETEALGRCAPGQAMLFGRPLDVSRLSARHWHWLITQVSRVERAVVGQLRPEVHAYFDALRRLILEPTEPVPSPDLAEDGSQPWPAIAEALEPTPRPPDPDPGPSPRGPATTRDTEAPAPEPAVAVAHHPPASAADPAADPDHTTDPADNDEMTLNQTYRFITTREGTPQRAPAGAPLDANRSAGPKNEPPRDLRRRVVLHGVAFDALTERECVRHIADRLDAGRGGWVITPNLDHVRRAQHDEDFRAMLREADLVVPDGMPLIWASRLQGTPLPERVAGSSMVSTLAAAADEAGRSLFLLGGEPGAAEEAGRVLRQRHPSLRIAGTLCPPLGFERDPQQMQAIRAALHNAQPDIVYVALGSPKQERLIRELRGGMSGTWWLGVGISLSFICGRVKRAPPWVQRLGLEWAHRLAQEPRRLARRYLVEGLPFAARLLTRAGLNRLRSRRADTR